MGTSLHQGSRESLLSGCLTSAFFDFICQMGHCADFTRCQMGEWPRAFPLTTPSLQRLLISIGYNLQHCLLQPMLPCTQLLLTVPDLPRLYLSL